MRGRPDLLPLMKRKVNIKSIVDTTDANELSDEAAPVVTNRKKKLDSPPTVPMMTSSKSMKKGHAAAHLDLDSSGWDGMDDSGYMSMPFDLSNHPQPANHEPPMHPLSSSSKHMAHAAAVGSAASSASMARRLGDLEHRVDRVIITHCTDSNLRLTNLENQQAALARENMTILDGLYETKQSQLKLQERLKGLLQLLEDSLVSIHSRDIASSSQEAQTEATNDSKTMTDLITEAKVRAVFL